MVLVARCALLAVLTTGAAAAAQAGEAAATGNADDATAQVGDADASGASKATADAPAPIPAAQMPTPAQAPTPMTAPTTMAPTTTPTPTRPQVPEAAAHYHGPPARPPRSYDWSKTAPQPRPRLHAGFYTNIQVMGGLLSAGDVTDGVEDATGVAVSFGRSLFNDRLVFFLQLDLLGDQSVRSIGVGSFGIGAGYYLRDPNLMFALQLGGTTLYYVDQEGSEIRQGGGSIALRVAHEWPIDDGPLAAGLAMQLRSATLGGQDDDTQQLAYLAATLGLSLTYH